MAMIISDVQDVLLACYAAMITGLVLVTLAIALFKKARSVITSFRK